MAQLPVLLRPKFLIRQRALRSGLLGPSRLWRYVAFVIIFENGLRKLSGKNPDRLGTRTIGVGHVISVAAYKPLTRKQRRASGISEASLEAAARADLEGAQQAS